MSARLCACVCVCVCVRTSLIQFQGRTQTLSSAFLSLSPLSEATPWASSHSRSGPRLSTLRAQVCVRERVRERDSEHQFLSLSLSLFKGLSTEGLYRIPGNHEVMSKYIRLWDSGVNVSFGPFEQEEASGIIIKVYFDADLSIHGLIFLLSTSRCFRMASLRTNYARNSTPPPNCTAVNRLMCLSLIHALTHPRSRADTHTQ